MLDLCTHMLFAAIFLSAVSGALAILERLWWGAQSVAVALYARGERYD